MDVLDLVSWVREHNWAIVIGYKEAEYNVFDIDKTDPWRHKWVPDPGRIPARKPSVRKRLGINKRENVSPPQGQEASLRTWLLRG